MSTCVQHGNADEGEAATLAGLCGGVMKGQEEKSYQSPHQPAALCQTRPPLNTVITNSITEQPCHMRCTAALCWPFMELCQLYKC
ncbi:hypothetical protein E2C01_004540 [Portunus trituberculatus]|uniref:Uncharacterized protein n=1 Tax=Portunus trituberculatus TaxID=210409 RepID=A0A5B7CRM9_PORTR|nr:hypothetical protein [Portunus trituberculatus]